VKSRSSRYPRIIPPLPGGDGVFELLCADRHLAELCEHLRLLKFITPVNSDEVRADYLRDRLPSHGPDFLYRDEDHDFDAVRRDLFSVPLNSGSELGLLYRRKRDELNDTVAMLQARGTTEFRERSRLLYGTTTEEELEAMSDWLQLPPDPPAERTIPAREAVQYLRSRLSQSRLAAEVKLRRSLGSFAAAGEHSIGVRADAQFSQRELERIFLHEAETHILRYRNGEMQPFRALFYYGFPRHGDGPGNYLFTEEGLATFQEEVSGYLTNDRKRNIAGRALAVHLMDTEELGFNEVYSELRTKHNFDGESAYAIVERAFRGGGYTKDHIYYTGYRRVAGDGAQRRVRCALAVSGQDQPRMAGRACRVVSRRRGRTDAAATAAKLAEGDDAPARRCAGHGGGRRGSDARADLCHARGGARVGATTGKPRR
jgi:uncharacterized protein (TIGR02421 family)